MYTIRYIKLNSGTVLVSTDGITYKTDTGTCTQVYGYNINLL